MSKDSQVLDFLQALFFGPSTEENLNEGSESKEEIKSAVREAESASQEAQVSVKDARVTCTKAGSEADCLQMDSGSLGVSTNQHYELERIDIKIKGHFKSCSAKGCDGKCTVEWSDILDEEWKDCMEETGHGEGKLLLNSLYSYMICTKGGGYIYFLDSGQELKEYVDRKDTSNTFVGYLAYGAGEITDNKEEGFFMLYDSPTLQSEGESYYFTDLYKKYNVERFGALQSFGGQGCSLNMFGNTKYGNQNFDPNRGTLVYNGIERYAIALGPTLQDPQYDGKKIDGKKMAYGTCVDIAIDVNGEYYYIPAIIVDVKDHSWPTGVIQSGVPFSGGEKVDTGKTGPIVEWYTPQIDKNKNNKADNLNSFNLGGSITIYRNEVLK